MDIKSNSTNQITWVAMDISKYKHDVLIEHINGKKKKFKIQNNFDGHNELINYLAGLKTQCVIGFEATGNYHRTIAYNLHKAGFSLKLISSFAACKTREAMHNSWDKNDPKDTQVILHMLKTGLVQTYYDPLLNNYNDIQEISKTYHQTSLQKVKIQHSILNHYLPLYFPEAEKYYHSSRALWFTSILHKFPTPTSISKFTFDDFVKEAWDVSGRKVNKMGWLLDFYETAKNSIGLPVEEASDSVSMFRIVLTQHQRLCQTMKDIEGQAESILSNNQDYQLLQSIPGIGPIIALTILAEAGNLKRFNHYKQFLKFCGFDLRTHQSGCYRGKTRLSKFGNARLRYVFWIAGTVALRMRENSFRTKYENYIKKDPTNADLKRKAYTAVAAKMARITYGIIKKQTSYRCYYEAR